MRSRLDNIRRRRIITATIASACFFFAPPGFASTVTLDVDGDGQLLGATGVEINGAMFDVQFIDATCFALFDGCDKASDFTFATEIDARDAARSLIEQVFIDGPLGEFDSNPSLTNGINAVAGAIIIPYATASDEVLSIAAYNVSGLFDGPIGVVPFSIFEVTGDFSVFGVFSATAAVGEVPLPAAAWMFLVGLGGLPAALRRSKHPTAAS